MFRQGFFVMATMGMWLSAGVQVIPWVANKDATWGSEILLNNHGDESLMVVLDAVRADGSGERAEVLVAGKSQTVRNAGDLFPSLGSGDGFCVFVTTPNGFFTSSVRVASLQTASQFSPSMGTGIDIGNASSRLIYPALPGDGFSAPVIVNISEQDIDITLTVYTEAGPFGDSVNLTLGPKRPLADVITNYFPHLSGSAWLAVAANGPMLGANFSFNTQLEPSMVNAVTDPVVDDSLVEPLLVALDTSATVADAYNASTTGIYSKSATPDCPAVDAEVNVTQSESFVTANLDWGMGCTNAVGVYHSGSIELNMSRRGGLSDSNWMAGEMSFHNFLTRYRDILASVEGGAHFEASTFSQNYTFSADLTIAADTPIIDHAQAMDLNTQINVNRDGAVYQAFGTLDVDVDSDYHFYLTGRISSSDPLIYDYNNCPWPNDGRIDFTVFYTALRLDGWLNFETGDCFTAILNMAGVESEILLSDLY